MRQRLFKQIDVFTSTPYLGNPVAVVLAGDGLSDAEMASFARWTNLSETTFVLPPVNPSADYRLRIFTPGSELPFAGHPTLGSCHGWLEAGGQPKNKDFIVQECAKGLVKIRRDGTGERLAHRLAFAAPDLSRSAPSPVVLAQVAAKYGYEKIGRARMTNDSLIGTSAARKGIALLTVNERDFARIAEFCPLQWSLR